MILIRSKEQYQNCSCQQEPKDEAFSVERLSNLAAAESALLKPSSDFVGNSAGIGSDKITGSNGAGDVASFGQVASIISGGSESGVAARRNSGEGNESSLLSSDFQSPLSVDSLDAAKRNLNSSEQIVENHSLIRDFHTRTPEQQETAEPKPASQDGTFQQARSAELDNAKSERQQQDSAKDNAQVSAEAGSKSHIAMTLGGK